MEWIMVLSWIMGPLSKFVFSQIESILTFWGLVPKRMNDVTVKDKEEHISMRDLRSMIQDNLQALKEKQTEEIDNMIQKNLQALKEKQTEEINNMFQFNLQVLTEKQTKDMNNLEGKLGAEIRKALKEKQTEEINNLEGKLGAEMRKKFQAHTEQFQHVLEILNYMKSKEVKIQEEEIKMQRKIEEVQRRENEIIVRSTSEIGNQTLESSTQIDLSDADNIIFNYISPDELSSKEQELKSLKREIKKKRKDTANLVKLLMFMFFMFLYHAFCQNNRSCRK